MQDSNVAAVKLVFIMILFTILAYKMVDHLDHKMIINGMIVINRIKITNGMMIIN